MGRRNWADLIIEDYGTSVLGFSLLCAQVGNENGAGVGAQVLK